MGLRLVPRTMVAVAFAGLLLAALCLAAFEPARGQDGQLPPNGPYRAYVPLISAASDDATPLETPLTTGTCRTDASPLWFSYTPWTNPQTSPYKAWVEQGLSQYRAQFLDYQTQIAEYQTGGDFLNWGVFRTYKEGTELRFDANGIPMINANGDGIYYYQPTTIAQYALTLYGRHVHGIAPASEFLHVAEFLLTLQDGSGAFPLRFPFYYYRMDRSFSPGWASSLTQAQAMSVFARAWYETGDERFRAAGDRALAFMTSPASEGGTLTSLGGVHRDLSGYVWFRTFPSLPTSYTLNGFMFTMLGLYDWWQLDPEASQGASAEAGAWFRCSQATLGLILPLFDLGGFSAYDLGHYLRGDPNAQAGYHAIHIALLHALVSVTGDSRIEQVETRWRAYVE